MHVLLFDIDGTLINTQGAGGAALRAAFSELFGVDRPARVEFSGRTDRAIAGELFQSHGIEDTPVHWNRLRAEYLLRLAEFLPRRPGRLLPGVSELLSDMAGRADMLLGLLTGNVREGARIKLEHFGLQHFFAVGGYGDEHYDRNDVARWALREVGLKIAASDMLSLWVIGDTPHDIRCARAIGAQVLAVATGIHSQEELAHDQPDALVATLHDARDLFARFGSDRKPA